MRRAALICLAVAGVVVMTGAMIVIGGRDG